MVLEIFLIEFDVFDAAAVVFGEGTDVLKSGFGGKFGNGIGRELFGLLFHWGDSWLVCLSL